MVSSKLFCRGPQQLLPWKKSRTTTAASDSLQISSVFTPQVFVLADASHLGPQPCFVFSALTRAWDPRGSQPWPQWLHECKMLAWTSAVIPHYQGDA